MSQIKELDITNEKVAKEVHALQQLAYRIEADLIKNDKIPYLTQGLSTLMRTEGETFLGYHDEEGNIRGVFSYKILNEGVLDVHRFMIHPSVFRQGIGSKLLNHVLDNNLVRKVIAQTGVGNTPAIEFYKNNGIDWVCDIQVDRTVKLATFEKVIMSLEEYKEKGGE